MQLDQNTIVLSPANGIYEEYVLDPAVTGNPMPGALVITKQALNGSNQPVVQADGISTAVVTTTLADGADIDTIEPLLLVENALLGKSINHKAFAGEVTPLYRPVSGDRFLVRAVAGNYADGDPLYFISTANGIYVTNDKTAAGAGTVVKAYAVESFTIPAATNTALRPAFYYDVVDDSTTERPATTRMNGGVVNLLRVRFA